MTLSNQNVTLAASAVQELDINFTAASLMQGTYSTRLCAYNQSETGSLLTLFVYMPQQSKAGCIKRLSSR